MIPKHSSRAAKALAYFKRAYNDIDIYVEDTGNHNMWLALIRRIIPLGTKITSVNLLGGKECVIQACKLDQKDDGRKKIYIIDGDFDFILDRKKPKLKYLYRLKAYCIENLLINEAAAMNVGLLYNPRWDEEKIAAELRFNESIDDIYRCLAPLFQVYACAFDADNRIRTIGNCANHLFDNCADGVKLCKYKVWRLCLKVAKLTRNSVGYPKFKKNLRRLRERVSDMPYEHWISGKDYVFPMLRIIFRRRLSVNCDAEQLKVLLASNWPDHVEPGLARRVRALCA